MNEWHFTIQEADIAVTQMLLSWSLFNRLDVSIPLYTAGSALIVPWPEEESRLLAPIHPFQPMVLTPKYYQC